MPSVVFLGDILYAKGLLPHRLPNNKPPLSACQDKQKVIIMNLGLKIIKIWFRKCKLKNCTYYKK